MSTTETLSALEERSIHFIEKLERERRLTRRTRYLPLLGLASLLLLSAVEVSNEDLEILPNESGGNPNDSYALKWIGDGSTGADRAMSIQTIVTSDSDYRLAILDNGGTERVSIDDDGNLGIGDTSPNYTLDVDGDTRTGQAGSSTRIKILPKDFYADDDIGDGNFAFDEDGTNKGIRVMSSSSEMFCSVTIPKGYKATHATIYGNSTDLCLVYAGDLTDGVGGASLGSANMNNEIDFTDLSSDSTNGLTILINVDSSADIVYGGSVTIVPQ